MIQVKMINNMGRTTTNVELTSTPRELLNARQISSTGLMPTVNGQILSNSDLDTPFSEFMFDDERNIQEGDVIDFSLITKGDGGQN